LSNDELINNFSSIGCASTAVTPCLCPLS
jgi:hypothetical protein